MSSFEQAKKSETGLRGRRRNWFARSLGVRPERKEEIYIELSKSASLIDASYWLQILFASGIATIGLVLGSPAVIIGAMLISPLMGPILSGGLALAAGDVVLGLRSITSLMISSIVAVAFSVLLVGLLPFKEMTPEIAARTQPNTLDLVVALFSGAIGSIATCKEVKGVVTSIPGVAIAVALMPPLCVVGYGLGVAFSLNVSQGMTVARGGGLLFLTNLVAITFSAMLVFLALHIDTKEVRNRVHEWCKEDKESAVCQDVLRRFRVSDKIKSIGSLPGRFILIGIPILVILIPLTESFNQLRRDFSRKQESNRIRLAATQLWQQDFERLPSGEPRSYLDQLSVSMLPDKLALFMRVFTKKPYSPSERNEFTRVVAARLNRPADSIDLQIVEIPTTSSELAAKVGEESRPPAPPTVAQLQAGFLQGIESALGELRLPPPAQMLDYRVETGTLNPLQITVSYLSERDIEPDAESLIADQIKASLNYPAAAVSLERIPALVGQIEFKRNKSELTATSSAALDLAGQILQRRTGLRLEINMGDGRGERETIAGERAKTIAEYLASKWGVAYDRMEVKSDETLKNAAALKLSVTQAAS